MGLVSVLRPVCFQCQLQVRNGFLIESMQVWVQYKFQYQCGYRFHDTVWIQCQFQDRNGFKIDFSIDLGSVKSMWVCNRLQDCYGFGLDFRNVNVNVVSSS